MKEDIQEVLECFKLFFTFLIKPKEIIAFVNKRKGWKFSLSIILYFVISTGIFTFLISYFNTKEFITKWIPLVIIIQSIIYIPLCLLPLSFRNANTNNKLIFIIKTAIVEALIVHLTLLYLGIIFYFQFLITESYFFYYLYLIYSICVTLYICIYFPLSVSEKKMILSIILTYMCSVGINYFTLLVLSETSYGNKTIMLDVVYQESIEKTAKVIEFAQYANNHQKLIVDLEEEYINNGNKEVRELLNKQIDLILMKKQDIYEFNKTIKFNRNKKELMLLMEILDAYEKIKREINLYEQIPNSFQEQIEKKSIDLKQLIEQRDTIKHKIEEEVYIESLKDELQQVNDGILEIQSFIDNSSQTRKQIEINIEAVREINKQLEFINLKEKNLMSEVENTQKYWDKRQKFLF